MVFGKYKKLAVLNKLPLIGGKHGRPPVLTEEQKAEKQRRKEIVEKARADMVKKIKDEYGFDALL